MRASAAREAGFGDASADEGAEFVFEAGKWCIDQLPARNDDDIESRARLVVTKKLADPPLGPVAHDGAAELTGSGNAQPGLGLSGASQEDQHVAAVHLQALLVHPLEIGAAANVLIRAKRVAHAPRPAWRA